MEWLIDMIIERRVRHQDWRGWGHEVEGPSFTTTVCSALNKHLAIRAAEENDT